MAGFYKALTPFGVYVYFCEETNPSIAHTLLVSEAFVERKFFGACLPDKIHNEWMKWFVSLNFQARFWNE